MTATTASASPMASRPSASSVLRVHVAGFARRLFAAAVDTVLMVMLCSATMIAVLLILRLSPPSLKEIGPDLLLAGLLDRTPIALGTVGVFLGFAGLYQLYFVGVSGQTLGKRLFGIRVIGLDGQPPGAARSLLRLFALAVALFPAGLGWSWALFDRERRGLHDHIAGTYVILDR